MRCGFEVLKKIVLKFDYWCGDCLKKTICLLCNVSSPARSCTIQLNSIKPSFHLLENLNMNSVDFESISLALPTLMGIRFSFEIEMDRTN